MRKFVGCVVFAEIVFVFFLVIVIAHTVFIKHLFGVEFAYEFAMTEFVLPPVVGS